MEKIPQDILDAAKRKYPYPTPDSYRSFSESVAEYHKSIDYQRSLYIQGRMDERPVQQPVSLKWLKIPDTTAKIEEKFLIVDDEGISTYSNYTGHDLISYGHTHYIPLSSLLVLEKEE